MPIADAILSLGQVTALTEINVGTATRSTFFPTEASIISSFNYESTSAAEFRLGLLSYMEQTVATVGSAQALEGYASTTHTTGDVNLLIACIGNSNHAGGGTASWIRGGSFGAGLTGAGNAAVVDGLYIQSSYRTGAGIGAVVAGIRVGPQTVGTTNQAIITEGTASSTFGGMVSVLSLNIGGTEAISSTRSASLVNATLSGVLTAVTANASSVDQVVVQNTESVHAYALRVPGSSSGAGPGYFVLRDNTRAAVILRAAPTTGDFEMVGKLAVGQITTIDASAALEVESTTGGLLLPRLTTTQRDAIASAANGLLIYNTTTNQLNLRAAGAWTAVT